MLRKEIEHLWEQVENIDGQAGYRQTLAQIDGLIAEGRQQVANKTLMAELYYMKGYWIYQESEDYLKATVFFYKSLAYKPNYFWPKLYLGHTLFDTAISSLSSEGRTVQELAEDATIKLLEAQFLFNSCLNQQQFIKTIGQEWRITKLYELQASIFLYLSDFALFQSFFLKYKQSVSGIEDSVDIPLPTEL